MVTAANPLIIAALAAALMVYIPLPLFRLVLVISLAALSLVYYPGRIIGKRTKLTTAFSKNPVLKKIEKAAGVFFHVNPVLFTVIISAAALGIAAGLWSVSRIQHFAPGVPVEKIHSLKGILLDDPRSLSSFAVPDLSPETERGMALLELRESGAKLPGCDAVASARGNVAVFFPAGTMPRLREFGRGAVLYVEGSFTPDDAANNTASNTQAGSGSSPSTSGWAAVPRFRAVSVHVVKAAPALEQMRSTVRLSVLNKLTAKSWGGLAAALLLGTRENLEDNLALSFRKAGLSHVLAISGMHLAFLSGLLAFVLRRPLGKKGAIWAGLVFIVLYVFLVGPQPSLVRAAIMYVFGSFLILSGTAANPLALLGAAFLVQISWEPSSAYSVSFILSYLALGGLLVLSGKAAKLLKGAIPDSLSNGLGASIGAFLATAPITAAFFGILYPVGIFAGLVAAPLSSAFMALSIAWLAVAKVPLLGAFLDWLLKFLQFLLQWSVSLFARLPGFSASTIAVCVAALVVIAAVVVLAYRLERHRSYLAPFRL